MISTIRFAEVPGGKKPRYFLRLKKLMGLLGDAQAGVHCRPPPKSWCAYDWAAYLPTGFRFRAALKFWVLAALAGQNNSKMCTIRPDLECNHRLTERECSILTGIVAGGSCEESSGALKISLRTIKVYRGGIMAKLGAKNAADLIRVMLTTGCSPSRSKSIGYSQSPEIKVAVTALGASVKKPESDPGAPRRVRATG